MMTGQSVLIYLLVCLPPSIFTLKHGDRCSWEAEKSRENYLRRGTYITQSSNSSGLHNELWNELEELKDKVCPTEQNLVCSKRKKECVCGIPGLEYLYEESMTSFALDTEGKCQWTTGGFCFPEEWAAKHLNFNSLISIDLKCESGTTCKTQDGSVCSAEAMNPYSTYSKKGNVDLTREVTSGRVCSCQVDSDFAEAVRVIHVEEIPRAEAHVHDTSITILFGKSSQSSGSSFDYNSYQTMTGLLILAVNLHYVSRMTSISH